MEHKISLLKRAGESAFPVKMDMGDGSRIEGMGMSLRDYIAAKAMQGLLSDPNAGMLDDDMNHWAALSYKMADAMLRVREK